MIRVMRQRALDAKLRQAKSEAWIEVGDILRKVIKGEGAIYTEPVNIKGDNNVVKDSLFLGCSPYAISIDKGERNIIEVEEIK